MLSGRDRVGHPAVAWLDPENGATWHTAALRTRAPVVLLADGHVAYWYADASRGGAELDLADGVENMIPPMPAAFFAWTGTQLLVWGGGTGVNDRVAADGAALTLASSD